MKRAKLPKPPKHLGQSGRAWYRKIAADFVFSSSAELELLAQAAECLDRIDQARQAIAEHGLLIATACGKSTSYKPNPATAAERDFRTLFARLNRELGLIGAQEDDPRIPRNQTRGTRR